MSRSKLQFALLPLLLSFNCSDLDNVSITKTGSTLIEKNDSGVDVGTIEFSNLSQIDLEQIAKDNGRELSDIDTIKLKSAVLDLPFPQNANFNFADAIEFYVEAEGALPKKIASISPVPQNTNAVVLDVDPLDLLSFSESKVITITSRLVGDSPEFDTQVKATVDLEVDVNVTEAAGCSGS